MTSAPGWRPAVWLIACPLAAALAGCATKPPETGTLERHVPTPTDDRVPGFLSRRYEPFARADAVGIAVREWHLFGNLIDDDPPDTRPTPPADLKPERMPGLWERVGEYWWLGQDPNEPEGNWTGKHDADGTVFPAGRDGYFAWSAAFISYVMRIAGAGSGFLYSPTHSDYINAARENYGVMHAEPPDSYAPQPGDLICLARGRSARLTFAMLPTGRFPGHCDIVVSAPGQAPSGAPAFAGQISVVGGNVDDAVTLKHIPVTSDGMLSSGPGGVLDTRYPWFVVLRISYDR